MCIKCDDIEGNLCRKCEQDMEEVKHAALYDDGWWPALTTHRRDVTVASVSNDAPKELMYV